MKESKEDNLQKMRHTLSHVPREHLGCEALRAQDRRVRHERDGARGGAEGPEPPETGGERQHGERRPL